MRIRDFAGADYEPASKFLGTIRHASHGARSFWYGADELCYLLSQADHAFVAEDNGRVAGLAIVKSPDAGEANRELRMHWMQQRQIIATVCVSFEFNPREDEADYGTGPTDALVSELGDAAGLVSLVCVSDEGGADVRRALENAICSWLSARGVTVQEQPEDLAFLPNGPEDRDAIYELLNAYDVTQGVAAKSFGYHVEVDGKVVAGCICWSYGSDLYVDSIAVDESLRRQGIGTRLLELAEQRGREEGCQTISLDTFSHQAPDYYPKLGFEEIFRRRLDDGSVRYYFTKRL